MEPLQEERDFFARSLEDWLPIYEGKVALVKGQQLYGVFDTDSNALHEGARRFGREPFLIRPIGRESDITLPAYTSGLLNAYLTYTAQ